MTLPSLKARQKPPKRAWRHDQRIGAKSMAAILPTDILTSVLASIADRLTAPSRGRTRSMSPEELRKRLERAGLTPYRLSYLLGVEPNEIGRAHV